MNSFADRQIHRFLALVLLLVGLPHTIRALPNTFVDHSDTYSVVTGSRAFDSIFATTGSTRISLSGDDVVSGPVALPFPFFFRPGQPSNSIRISTNGIITFGSSAQYTNTALPASGMDNTALAFWDDLWVLSTTDRGVEVKTLGVAPFRVFVVESHNLYHYGYNSSLLVTFQTRIFEGTGAIEFVYGDVNFDSGTGSYDGGVSATVGVQIDSTDYLQYSFNERVLTNDSFIRFNRTAGAPQVVGLTPPASSTSATQNAVSFQFSGNVNIDASKVRLLYGSQDITAQAAFSYDAQTYVGRLTYPTNLNAGQYTVTVLESVTDTVNGLALDGDFDGVPGGNYVAQFSVNTPPVLQAIPNATSNELVPWQYIVQAQDVDMPAQVLSYDLVTAPSGMQIGATTGALSWTPAEVQGPGVYNVTVRVRDNGIGALSDTKSFTFTVAEVNTAPSIGSIPDQAVAQGGTVSFQATAQDGDLPAQQITFSFGVGAPQGAVINPATGQFSWTLSGPPLQPSYSITVIATDNGTPALSASTTVNVAINTSPVLQAIPNATINELVPWQYTAQAQDVDMPAQVLTYDLVTAPSGMQIGAVTGLLSWTPTEAQGPGTYSVTVRVRDNGIGTLSDTKTFTLTVAEVNLSPSIDPIPDQTVAQGGTVSFRVAAHDGDIPAQQIIFSLGTGAPQGAAIDSATGQFSWTLTGSPSQSVYNISIIATDSGTPPLSASTTVHVAINSPPVLQPISNATINELIPFQYTVQAQDIDVPAQVLTYDLVAAPLGMQIGASSGVIQWTPTEAQGSGIYSVTVRVRDNGIANLSDTKTFILTVAEVNTAPSVNPIPAQTVLPGGSVSFQAIAHDTDLPVQQIVFSLGAGAPPGASIDPSTGQFSWTLGDSPSQPTYTITVIVTDNGIPALSGSRIVTINAEQKLFLSLSQPTVAEAASVSGMVSVNITPATPLTVSLGVSQANRLTFPATVVIPAGQTSAPFTVQAVQNQNIEPTVAVSLIASATGYTASTFALQILDDDAPTITFTLDHSTVSENGGALAVRGTVALDRAASSALTVTFTANSAGQITLPASLSIPANTLTFPVPINVIDNTAVDGNRTVTITAHLYSGNQFIADAPPVNLMITDDEGPSLSLAFDRTLLVEGRNPAATGMVSVAPIAGVPIIVTLTPSDGTRLLVPATVTIPAGQGSANFAIGAGNDGVPTGTQTVSLNATANGYNPASAALQITDVQKPDLTVEILSPPTGAETDAWIDVRVLLTNQGATDAQGPFTQRILLSSDNKIGDDVLLTQADFAGRLLAGGSIEQSLRVRMPRNPGRYWLVAHTDVNLAVDEVTEDNNGAISETPLDIEPAYTTTLSIVPDTVPTGTAIPITGTATLRAGGAAAFALVNIHITNQGTERVISALTNSVGQFIASFTPLPGQGGLFQFGASHPGVTTAPVQDEVGVYGLKAEPVSLEFSLSESGSQSGSITIRNLADLPVAGLTTSVDGLPAGIVFTPTLTATSIVASGTVALNYSVTSSGPLARTTFTLSIQSGQGAAITVPIAITVAANVPKLVADPGQLFAGMLRGGQQVVNLSLKNDGRAPTAPVNLLLPSGISWMRPTTVLPIPVIAPGDSVPISIQLTPPADLALGDHTGSFVASDGTTSVSIPFRFRTLSDQRGQLVVRAEDEYTYYASGNPPLAGAAVKVTDAISGQVVGTMTTDASGTADFGQVTEGYYAIEVTAGRHSTYQGTHLVEGGKVKNVQAFLSRQTVTYTWTVVPVQIEDRYKITIDTKFETVVPIPVVTVEPTVIDLAEITTDEAVVNVKLANHGLIAAKATQLNFPTHPLWKFTPAIDQIGDLPAMSSITVPVRIQKLSAPGVQAVAAKSATAYPAAASDSGPCHTSATVSWQLVCGGSTNIYSGSIAIPNARSGCGGSPPSPGGGGGSGGSGGSGGGGGTYSAPVSQSSPPVPCDKCLRDATVDCIISYIPVVGDIYGWAGCIKSVFENSGEFNEDTAEACLTNFLPTWVSCIWSFAQCFQLTASASGKAFSAAAADFSSDPLERYAMLSSPALSFMQLLLDDPDGKWLAGSSRQITNTWLAGFRSSVAASSESGILISNQEASVLAALPLPPNVTVADVTRITNRWNRTFVNWRNGIFESGDDANFIRRSSIETLANQLVAARAAAQSDGFDTPEIAFQATLQDALNLPSNSGICARVKLRIEQEAVITRDAFRAMLELENQGSSPLQNVRVDVRIRSTNGFSANSLFGINLESVSGATAVDGTGSLPANGSATAKWLIIPTVDAAPSVATQFLVGGTLSYRLDGLDVTIPFSDVAITVLPSPRLTLEYFHQRDVFSDDPFTSPIEPAIPYSLAVMVQNDGAGVARNFRVTSGEPTIIENEKGLIADFRIIATQVAGQPLQPSLTANFGDINPNEIKIGQWLFTSSLQGLFTDYRATFEHIDGLGNPRLSLIDHVEIHEMIHQVRALGALDDGQPDFLVNDEPDDRDLPDTMFLSDGTTAPVAVVESAQATGQLTKTLTTALPAGWAYLRVPEPSNGQYELTRVVRSDGLEIPLDVNAWVTDRTFIGLGQRPTYENILHLLDYNSTGSYTLTYVIKAGPDVTPPASKVAALAAQSAIEFPVNWSGSDDRCVAFYDLYVSTDGGAWQLWLQRSQETGAIFQGELGYSYAFYSQATDGAGNLEAAPATADATTQVTLGNIAPTLAVISDQEVTEGDTLMVDLTGNDPDGRSDLLTYAFTSSVPPGVTINSQTGHIRWVTGEADGGRTVPVTVRVTDTGAPAQSATRSFVITVLEDNKPPVLADVAPQRVAVGGTLTLQLNATDSDLPAQMLNYRFAGLVPNGMTIDGQMGVITWQPALADADRTVLVSVAVADSGSPVKEAGLSFPVTVEPSLVDRPPQFYSTPIQLWLSGTTRSLEVDAFDPDGDAVTMALNLAGLPGGLSFTSVPGTGRGLVTWNTAGVAPGIYSLPVQASARLASTAYTPLVKIVPDNAYWKWATDSLKNLPDTQKSDPTSDPDGDGTANIFEWALLRNPLANDATPMSFSLEGPYEGGWLAVILDLHRRRGANQFVTLTPQFTSDLQTGSWIDIPLPDWEVFLDPFGDRDKNPNSEEVVIRAWLNPSDPAPKGFFRIKSSMKPTLP